MKIVISKEEQEILWAEYGKLGYGFRSGYKGFSEFVKVNVPGSKVSGNAKDGWIIWFDNEAEYTWFKLRWS